MGDGFHPALVFFVGAAVVAALRGVARSAVSVLVPVVSFVLLLGFEPGVHGHFQLLEYALEPIRVDDLSLLFGYLFHLAAFVGVVYAWHVRDGMQQVAALARSEE
ncbi:MAG: Na(+)/H(+) antiporter subunit D, partial [Planctomycetota bacterium JB042]